MNRSQLSGIVNIGDENITLGTPGTYMPEAHPCRLFHQYWLALSKQRDGLPERPDFAPSDIPRLLPFIVIFDIDSTGAHANYRYRLVGTEIVDMLDMNPTGKLVSEVVSASRLSDRLRIYDLSVEQRTAVFTSRHVPVEKRSFIPVFTGLFPFAARSGGPPEQLFMIAARREIEL